MILTHYYYLNELGSKKNQEDFIWPDPLTVGTSNKIFIVCDGVGGSSKGEIASRMVAEYVGNALQKADLSLISADYINSLLLEAKDAMNNYSRKANAGGDMATTFAMLVFYADKAFISWCGDSRVYHFRKGVILYKTEDHSLVNSLIKSGELTETEASIHPQKNIILKAIKADSAIIDAEGGWTSAIETGDYFLLCTDGLLENWSSEDLAALLEKNDKTKIDMVAAIQSRCFNNTRDNYSMYLLKVKMEEDAVPKKRGRGLFLLLFVCLAVIAVAAYLFYRKPWVAIPPSVTTNSVVFKKDTTVIADSSGRHVIKALDTMPAPVPSVEIINPEKKTSTVKQSTDSISRKKPKTLNKPPLNTIDSGSIHEKVIAPEEKKDTAGAGLAHP